MKPAYFLLILVLFAACGDDKPAGWNDVVADKPSEVLRIEIFGEQFKWTVRYAGGDNELGKFDYKLTNERNPLGLMTTKSIEASLKEYKAKNEHMEEISLHADVTEEFIKEQRNVKKIVRLLNQMRDKHDDRVDDLADNDFMVNDTLVLCVDEEYAFQFRSKDVIHSVYFPEFRAQMNAVPGMQTRFKYTPTETTKERRVRLDDDTIDFHLMCNKICGAGHYTMKMVVRVVEKDEYLAWIKAQNKQVFRNLEPYSVSLY